MANSPAGAAPPLSGSITTLVGVSDPPDGDPSREQRHAFGVQLNSAAADAFDNVVGVTSTPASYDST